MSDRDVLLAMLEKAGIEIDEQETQRVHRVVAEKKAMLMGGNYFSDGDFIITPEGSMFSIEITFNADGSLKGIEAYE